MESATQAHHSPALKDIVARSLIERWKKYRKGLIRCQKKCTESSVHDLRVSLRRLISILDLVVAIDQDNRIPDLRRGLKKQFASFGPLRDVQMQILAVKKLTGLYPLLLPLLDILVSKERRLIKRLGKEIKQAKVKRAEKAIVAVHRALLLTLRDDATCERKRDELLNLVAAGFSQLENLRSRINPADTDTIHALRIAFKKFRYKIEVLHPLLQWATAENYDSMHAYQVRMGSIQDIEVLIGTVNTYAMKKRKRSNESLLPVHQELLHKKRELVEEFLASVDELRTFWQDSGVSQRETA